MLARIVRNASASELVDLRAGDRRSPALFRCRCAVDSATPPAATGRLTAALIMPTSPSASPRRTRNGTSCRHFAIASADHRYVDRQADDGTSASVRSLLRSVEGERETSGGPFIGPSTPCTPSAIRIHTDPSGHLSPAAGTTVHACAARHRRVRLGERGPLQFV